MTQDVTVQAPIPVVRVTDAGMPIDYRTEGMRWLVHQGPQTVLLFLILAAVGVGIYWHVTKGAPESDARRTAAFKEMIEGTNNVFKKINDDNNAQHKETAIVTSMAVKEMAASTATAVKEVAASTAIAVKEAAQQHSAAMDRMQSSFEKSIDRLDRRVRDSEKP